MTPQVIEVRLKRPRPDLLKLFAQPELAVLGRGGSGPYRARADPAGGVVLTPAIDLARPEEDRVAPRPGSQIRLRAERAAVAIARLHEGKTDVILGGTFADWPIVVAARVDGDLSASIRSPGCSGWPSPRAGASWPMPPIAPRSRWRSTAAR
ncbi:MAG: hypothetical protein WDN24_11465 [Sphingomonas sp.]